MMDCRNTEEEKRRNNKKESIVLISLFILICSFVFGCFLVKAERNSDELDTTVILVRSGETLSSIASFYCEGHNSRDTIKDIMNLNNMDSTLIYAGQELIIPVY